MAASRRNRRRSSQETLQGSQVLEDRRLLTASVHLDSPVIEVEGTDGNDLVVVQRDRSGIFGGVVLPRLSVTVLDTANNEVLASASFRYTTFLDPRYFSRIRINTGAGSDTIINYTELADVIDAGSGDDFVVAGRGHSVVLGRAGADQIRGQGGLDTLDGGAGHDVIDGDGGADLIYGRSGVDTLHGGDGDDRVVAGSDADVVRGQAGDDVLLGGPGDDVIYGGDGEDTLEGEAGNDFLYGGAAADLLLAGPGDDFLDGDSGHAVSPDRLDGGVGHDLVPIADIADQHGSVEEVLRTIRYEDAVTAIAAGDLDNDGRDEIYTAVRSDGRSEIFRSRDGESLGQRVWIARATEQAIHGLAVGDVDGNGVDELYYASEAFGVSRVMRVASGKFEQATEVWRSHFQTITAIAAGNVDSELADELFVGVQLENAGRSDLLRSDDGVMFDHSVWSDATGRWTIRALAAGSVRAGSAGELFIGLEGANGAALYRSRSGAGRLREIWRTTSRSWQIAGLTVGDPDDNGDGELFVGLNRANGDAHLFRSGSGRYLGDEIAHANGNARNPRSLEALAVGRTDEEGGASLFAGLETGNRGAALHRSTSGRDLGDPVWGVDEPSAVRNLLWPWLGYGLDLDPTDTDELFASPLSFGDIAV